MVGHSERRLLFGEDGLFIEEKFHHIKEHGMIPILCVGETLDDYLAGQTQAVLKKQIDFLCQRKYFLDGVVIAYEPVWAIGTGESATPEQAQSVHNFLREYIKLSVGDVASQVSIIYGGSVNEQNAADLFAMPDVDGVLVGGASLNAEQFVEIIKCIN